MYGVNLNSLWLNLIIINLWIGSPLESGPTPTLPDKKMLVVILDKLQKYVFFLYNNLLCFLNLKKNVFPGWPFLQFTVANLCRKDTYGVFSEPVDIEEVMMYIFDS